MSKWFSWTTEFGTEKTINLDYMLSYTKEKGNIKNFIVRLMDKQAFTIPISEYNRFQNEVNPSDDNLSFYEGGFYKCNERKHVVLVT